MDIFDFLRGLIIYAIAMVTIQYFFTGLIRKVVGNKNELEQYRLAQVFVKAFHILATILFVIWLATGLGLFDGLYGASFSGASIVLVFTYFITYMQTNNVYSYLIMLRSKNWSEGDYIKIFDGDKVVAEGQYVKMTTLNIFVKPWKEQSIVQVPLSKVVGYSIKNMDIGGIAKYSFSIVAHLDADITKIKQVVFDLLDSVKDVMTGKFSPFVVVSSEVGYFKMDFNYYCQSDLIYKSGYIKALNVWQQIGLKMVEKLRLEGLKIGLNESIWLNGKWEPKNEHLAKAELENRLGNNSVRTEAGNEGQPATQ